MLYMHYVLKVMVRITYSENCVKPYQVLLYDNPDVLVMTT